MIIIKNISSKIIGPIKRRVFRPKQTYKKEIYIKSGNFITKVLEIPKDYNSHAWCLIEHTSIFKIKKTVLVFEKGSLNVNN
jgi:hypothetical protein